MPNYCQNEAEKSCNLFGFHDTMYIEKLTKEVIPMVLEIDPHYFRDPGTNESEKVR